ncbi:glucosyltransferase [Chamberlinius hualienensis]
MMSLKVVALVVPATIFVTVSSFLLIFIYKAAFLPYMDEIFHIPQAQSYCKGNFNYWCSNITTPPGLYVFSVAVLNPIYDLVSNINHCSVLQLRALNILFSVGNLYLFYAIFNHITGHSKNWRWWHCSLTILTLATFPTLYFFTFLYYTDVGSTFFVLFTYLLTLKKCYTLSAAIGAISLFFRQTNIVWVGFCALLASNDLLLKYEGKELKSYDKSSWKYIKVTFIAWLGLLLNTKRRNYSYFLLDVVSHVGGFVMNLLGAIIFIIWNGGIVLGDKSSHQASIHFPQLFYYLTFTLFFACAHIITRPNFERFLSLNRKKLVFMAIFLSVIIAVNTKFHVYNLSDNRHFTFYFYSKLIRRHWVVKFLFIPMYLFTGFTMFDMLRQSQGVLWACEFVLCLTINLVFQTLLEFRYFIVGYLLFRLSVVTLEKNWTKTLVELVIYTLVNFYTIHLFVNKPFVSPVEDVLSRFMW